MPEDGEFEASLPPGLPQAWVHWRVPAGGQGAGGFQCLAANGAFLRLAESGDGAGRRAGEAVAAFLHDHALLQDACRAVARGGAAQRFELHLSAQGRWVDVTVFGPAAGEAAVLCDDITQRRLAELALQERSRRCEQLLRRIPDGTYAYRLRADGSRCLDYVSPRACAMVDIDPVAVLRDLDLAFAAAHPEDRVSLRESIAVAERRREPYYWEGRALVHGVTRWMRLAAEPMSLANGDTIWHGVLTDVTDRKYAEQALILARRQAESASLAKSRFFAAASHDLRQPIQAARLFLDALERGGRPNERRAWMTKLGSALRSLGELLEALLEIARIDAGMIQPRPRTADFETDIVLELERIFAPLALQRRLRFKLHFPRRGLPLSTDPGLLLALLRHLVRNAFAGTGRGGILISGRVRGDRALIQVWDTGVGIAADCLPHVYDEYFQVGNPERNQEKGLGLGLSVAKRLAALLGGEMSCRSRPGRGSVFGVWLPLAGSPAVAEEVVWVTSEPRLDDMAELRGRRVAVIEDHPLVADGIQDCLGLLGMAVTHYASPDEALADPSVAAADFVICDYRSQGAIDGVALLAAIEERRQRPVPAVILTGDVSGEAARKLADAGREVLYKPVDLSKLLELIGRSMRA